MKFPLLTERGQIEAQQLIDVFKAEMLKVADEVLGKLYCDIAIHIETLHETFAALNSLDKNRFDRARIDANRILYGG